DLPQSRDANRLIDLHSHTIASDGSLRPEELVDLAARTGLAALAITDHDTFAGYDEAFPFARQAGLDLVRGIELNSRLLLAGGDLRFLHLLAYWPSSEPSPDFHAWLEEERQDRRNRNRRLAATLQARGIPITLEEVEARGRSLAGRVHFARLLVEKGYARDHDDAFRRFLGEHAPTYVERESHSTEDAIAKIRAGGGVPAIAHPVRLSLDREQERAVLVRLKDAGLLGLEIYHSEHPPEIQAHYRQLAEELELLPTGGSDFHGAPKPEVRLGTGSHGNLRVPMAFLDAMRQRA
ncbi:MAG: PHP domain-containing protein, partial [Acidobacteriaceae bacterium]|nr:PHP domain-containing protein [Acidobacteriaceae bacterium]